MGDEYHSNSDDKIAKDIAREAKADGWSDDENALEVVVNRAIRRIRESHRLLRMENVADEIKANLKSAEATAAFAKTFERRS